MKKALMALFITIILSVSIVGCRQPEEVQEAESLTQGRLAYIGTDGNVYVVDASLTNHQQITTDATAPIEGSGRSYHRLAWSRGNILAYAAVERELDNATSQLFIVNPDADKEAILVGESDSHFVIYIYWSPQSGLLSNHQEFAYLIEEADGQIALRRVNLTKISPQNEVIGFGWPFYFSWSPDGKEMLWHTGGGRVDNSSAVYTHFQIDINQKEELELKPGLQLAPAYSPASKDTWLVVSAENNLILNRSDKRMLVAEGGEGDIAYVWSPNGKQIAYASRARARDLSYSPIQIFSLESGKSRRLIDIGLRPIGFFWSPDGEKLAYLQRIEAGNEDWMQWRVIDVNTGEDHGFSPFNPTPQMRFIVSSFNQYAQTHQFWSPDSRYLVYFERRAIEGDLIFRIDVAQEDSPPEFIAPGSLAFWSW